MSRYIRPRSALNDFLSRDIASWDLIFGKSDEGWEVHFWEQSSWPPTLGPDRKIGPKNFWMVVYGQSSIGTFFGQFSAISSIGKDRGIADSSKENIMVTVGRKWNGHSNFLPEKKQSKPKIFPRKTYFCERFLFLLQKKGFSCDAIPISFPKNCTAPLFQTTWARSTPLGVSATSRARAVTPITSSPSMSTDGSGPEPPTPESQRLTSPRRTPTGAPSESKCYTPFPFCPLRNDLAEGDFCNENWMN